MDKEIRDLMEKREAEQLARIKSKWTDAELEKLRDLYPKMTLSELTPHFPGKHTWQIVDTAKRLGLVRKQSKKGIKPIKWTPEELAYLEKAYGKTPIQELMKNLPGRTETAIHDKAWKTMNKARQRAT